MGIEEKWTRKGQTAIYSTQSEWEQARQVMQSMLDAGQIPPFKINKDTHQMSHSFVVGAGHDSKPMLGVFASNNDNEGIIDFGHFGMCKVILWEDGKKSAVKVAPDGNDINEILIMEKLGLIQTLFKREWEKRVHEKATVNKEPNKQWIRTQTITNKLYIAMPLIEGIDLNQYLLSNDAKDSMQAQRLLAVSIIHKLQDLHEKGIIHNDLHAGNIMVDKDLNAHLLDYGKSVDLARKPTSFEEISNRFGRRDTVAPEIAFFKTEISADFRFDQESALTNVYDMPVSTASDVYSLGQLLYKIFNPVASRPEMINLILQTSKSNAEERMPLAQVLETLESPAFIEMTIRYDESIADKMDMLSDESLKRDSPIPSEVVGSSSGMSEEENLDPDDNQHHSDTDDDSYDDYSSFKNK